MWVMLFLPQCSLYSQMKTTLESPQTPGCCSVPHFFIIYLYCMCFNNSMDMVKCKAHNIWIRASGLAFKVQAKLSISSSESMQWNLDARATEQRDESWLRQKSFMLKDELVQWSQGFVHYYKSGFSLFFLYCHHLVSL